MKPKPTKTREKVALVLLLLVATVEILFGVLYLYTPKILPYHEIFLEMRHEQLPPRVAALMLSMLKVVGILLVGQGVTLAVLTVRPFRRRESWAWWLIVVGSIGTLLPILAIMLTISLQSPWWLVVTVLGLLFLAVSLHAPFPSPVEFNLYTYSKFCTNVFHRLFIGRRSKF